MPSVHRTLTYWSRILFFLPLFAAATEDPCLRGEQEIDLSAQLPAFYDQGDTAICYSIAATAVVSAALHRETRKSPVALSQSWALATSVVHAPASRVEERIYRKLFDIDFFGAGEGYFDFGYSEHVVGSILKSGGVRASDGAKDLELAQTLSWDVTDILSYDPESSSNAVQKRAASELERLTSRDEQDSQNRAHHVVSRKTLSVLRFESKDYDKDEAGKEALAAFEAASDETARDGACGEMGERIAREILTRLCAKIPVAAALDMKDIETRGDSAKDWTSESGRYEHVMVIKGVKIYEGRPHFVFRNSFKGEETARLPVARACRIHNAIAVLGPQDAGYANLPAARK